MEQRVQNGIGHRCARLPIGTTSSSRHPKMKFAWFSVLCLLVIHTSEAFKDLFKHHSDDKPSLLDILKKPKIPGLSSHFGTGASFGIGSFGFGFGFGGQYVPSGGGVPPKGPVNVRPDYSDPTWEENKKEKLGPRPNWGHENDKYPKPGSYDDGKDDYSQPGSYEDYKTDYPNPGSFKENKEYPEPERKDSLPDWEDIGEKHPKAESMMEGDLVGDGLIHPRLNRPRNRRFIESRIFHVPLLFESNAKPYKVNISSNPNSLSKGNEKA